MNVPTGNAPTSIIELPAGSDGLQQFLLWLTNECTEAMFQNPPPNKIFFYSHPSLFERISLNKKVGMAILEWVDDKGLRSEWKVAGKFPVNHIGISFGI